MNSKQKIGLFSDTVIFQSMYTQLLKTCDAVGTLISQYRIMESDPYNFPCLFYKKGIREYIFPSQDVILTKDLSLSGSSGYRLSLRKQSFSHNISLVQGRVIIQYKDSHAIPTLKLMYTKSDSCIPAELQQTIDNIF